MCLIADYMKSYKNNAARQMGVLVVGMSWGIHHLRQGIRERTRVEPRESTDEGDNVDSRPSKVVLFPYFLASVPCVSQHVMPDQCH
jgi:hypothetical protein